MPVTGRIREIRDGAVVVDFSNGSWAEVPAFSSSRAEIVELMRGFAPPDSPLVEAAQIPFSVGEVVDLSTPVTPEPPADPDPLDRLLTAEMIRYLEYPSVTYHLYALHRARKGDQSLLTEVDEAIVQVDRDYPDSMEPITEREYYRRIEAELEADDDSTEEEEE